MSETPESPESSKPRRQTREQRLAKRRAREREQRALERTGSRLDIRRPVKDPYNPFSFRVARAKVMLEKGETWANVRKLTGLSKHTLCRLVKGEYDNHLPASTIEHARATETSKLTMVAGLALDSILEDPEKIRKASLQQAMTTAAIALDQRGKLEGLPSARIEVYVTMGDDEIDRELESAYRELRARMRDRGHVVEAEFENVTPGAGSEA